MCVCVCVCVFASLVSLDPELGKRGRAQLKLRSTLGSRPLVVTENLPGIQDVLMSITQRTLTSQLHC